MTEGVGWSAEPTCFSALQRAEIAEIIILFGTQQAQQRFSALQRAEIAEILPPAFPRSSPSRFSALQRAEIAEMIISFVPKDLVFEFQCSSTSRNC